MNEIVNEFKNQLSEYGLSITDKQMEQFNKYYELLIEWNEKINLTAITEYKDVLMKHFLDSVSIIKAYDMAKVNTLIDVGTGAGFPGIPIKIMFPHIQVTLLDSLQKRIVFLNTVILELDLKDVKTIHGRAEDFGKDNTYREKYDLCVSRAVANLSSLSELCIPFVNIDGCFISYKSDKSDEEIDNAKNAISILGGSIINIEKFSINENGRTLVVIKKVKSTGKKYPRKAGTPTKEPL